MSASCASSLQPLVDRLCLRSHLTTSEKEAILALPTQDTRLRSRQDLVQLHQDATSSSLIVSGLVARFGQTADGSRQITALHIPGDMVGLDYAIRPVGVGGLIALCDTVLLSIRRAAIQGLILRYPAVTEALWRDCMVDAAIALDWAVNVGRRKSRARLAHLFCEMAVRYGGSQGPLPRYRFPITQEQLADATGLTAVHINRTNTWLKKAGLVRSKNGQVEILDWHALVRFGEFEPSYLTGDATLKPART